MKLFIVVIRDRAADVFGIPNFVPNIGSAVRSFGDEVNRSAENNPLFAHPEDFDLFHIGVYDDETASFDAHVPRQIAIGKDMKRS